MKKLTFLGVFFCFLFTLPATANTSADTTKTIVIPMSDCNKKEKYCKGKKVYEDGNHYEGEFKYGNAHGWGTLRWVDGTIYIGEFLDGHRDGHGQQNFGNGDDYSGQWRGGEIHGKGVYLWLDGSKYVGTFVEGVMQGKGIITLSNGESYDGEWHNGVADGVGEYNRSDGSKYVGHHKSGEREGTGVITFRTGDIFIGKWKNGLANKKGTFQFSNGDKYVCIWEDGEMVGDATYIMVNGKEINGNLIQIEKAVENDDEAMESIGPNLGLSWYAIAMEQMSAKQFRLAKNNLKMAQKYVSPSSDLNKLIYQQLKLIEEKEQDGEL